MANQPTIKPKKRGPGCMFWLLPLVAIFIAGMATTIFPRLMLPAAGFLVCPQASTLEVTLGETQRYTNAAGEEQADTPLYLNCLRDGQLVKHLREEMVIVIDLFYAAVLWLVMLIAYVIIRAYRRRNAGVFEPPPPPVPPG